MKRIIAIVIIVHLLPMLGIFMEDVNGNDKWYKYIYVLETYIVGSYMFIRQYDRFVANGS